MPRDRARAFRELRYHDPRKVLIELRRIETSLVRSELPAAVRHLRTNDLKPIRELREACLFCYGLGQLNGQHVQVAHAEAQDYDAVGTWIDGKTQHFAPLQIKEVVPHVLNAAASVQAVVDSLQTYVDSQDLTVAIHLNRGTSFAPADLVIPPLKIAAVWVFGAITADQSRWALWGNFLETPHVREFDYPT